MTSGFPRDFDEDVPQNSQWVSGANPGTIPPKAKVGTVALVLANLVPLYGVLFLGWNAGFLLLAYWLENLVLGFYALLKMAFAEGESSKKRFSKFFLVPLFLVHYGAFCGVHGFFVLLLLRTFEPGINLGPVPLPSTEETWYGPFYFLIMLTSSIFEVLRLEPRGASLFVTALFISHGISFYANYLGHGEFRKTTANDMMFEPYRRIMALHIVILIGAVPVLALGSPVLLVVALVAAKIFLDLILHKHEHERAFAEGPV